jgi:hypothetical protein
VTAGVVGRSEPHPASRTAAVTPDMPMIRRIAAS